MLIGAQRAQRLLLGQQAVERVYLGKQTLWTPLAGGQLKLPVGYFALSGFGVTVPDQEEPTYEVILPQGAFALSGEELSVYFTDPHFSSVAFLCGFEGADGATSILDESPAGATVTFAGNAQIDTADSVFGASSLLLDGSGDYIQIPHINFGSAPFTLELRYQPLSLATNHNLISQWNESGASQRSFLLQIGHAQAGDGVYFHYSTNGVTNISGNANSSWVIGQKYAMAVDYDGSHFRAYKDGVMMVKLAFAGTIFNSTAPLQIGARNGAVASNPTNGRIDEVRVTPGVARFASDAGYTVATRAFPRD